MTPHADVYAGDLGTPTASGAGDGRDIHVFRITADAAPDVLSRIANAFNPANRPPDRATLRTLTGNRVEVEVALSGIAPSLADNIARKLDQLIFVTDVQLTGRAPE